MSTLPITDEQLEGLCENIDYINVLTETTAATATTPGGLVRDSLVGRLDKLGFIPAIAYSAGIEFLTQDDRVKTIERDNLTYKPIPSEIPFTTSGTWVGDDEDKFDLLAAEGNADQIELDNTDNDLEATNVQAGIDEISDVYTKSFLLGYSGGSWSLSNEPPGWVVSSNATNVTVTIPGGVFSGPVCAFITTAVHCVNASADICIPAVAASNIGLTISFNSIGDSSQINPSADVINTPAFYVKVHELRY